jgi:hypothetical protein
MGMQPYGTIMQTFYGLPQVKVEQSLYVSTYCLCNHFISMVMHNGQTLDEHASWSKFHAFLLSIMK